MRKWLLYAVTGTQCSYSWPCWKISLKLCQGEKKNPSELNKTVWLKFKQGWSLFLTQWLSAYAGPRSLCPSPRSLWRARSFYIFSKSEENKLLTHSCSTVERRGSHCSLLHLHIRVLSTWKPVFLSPCLSLSQHTASFFFFLYFCPRGICYLQNTTKSQAGLRVRVSSSPSLWKLFFSSFLVFFLKFLLSLWIRIHEWIQIQPWQSVVKRRQFSFSTLVGGFVIGVCVYSICARADLCERARVLCQFQRKETPKWIGSLLITRQR